MAVSCWQLADGSWETAPPTCQLLVDATHFCLVALDEARAELAAQQGRVQELEAQLELQREIVDALSEQAQQFAALIEKHTIEMEEKKKKEKVS